MDEPPLGPCEGSWFAYVLPRPTMVTGWLLPRRSSTQKVARLLSAVSASWEDDTCSFYAANSYASPATPAPSLASATGSMPAAAAAGAAAAAATAAAAAMAASSFAHAGAGPGDCGGAGSISRQASLGGSQSYVFSCGGLTVKQGLSEVAHGVVRAAPFVHCAPDSSCAIAFVGHLLNLKELAAHYCSPTGTPRRGGPGAFPPSGHAPAAAQPPAPLEGGASLQRQGSAVARGLDAGALTARVVLSMYGQESNECVLLSELQGQFAFVIIDSVRKVAFAARDPSGSETLFYRIGDDGSAAFASSRTATADAGAAGADAAAPGGEWLELLPGHYISGKVPRVHQFALTPEQLQYRELAEDLGPAGALRRTSLDPKEAALRALDGGVFRMDI